jgi:hypothetical protein
MALKRLSTGEMISLTSPWTQKNHPDRKVLLGVDEIAPLLPKIDDAHQALLSTQVDATPPPRLAALQEEQKRLDVRHDDILRGCFTLPQALAYLAKDPNEAKALLALQKTLLPDGLKATQKSYRDEAGQAAMLEKRLTAEDVSLLKSLEIPGGTLWDAVNEWRQLGAQLGKLEDERVKLEGGTGTMPADVLTARNRWIRAVNAVRTVLDLLDDGNEKLAAIVARIDEAERKADRRGASGGSEGEGEKAPADAAEAPKGG